MNIRQVLTAVLAWATVCGPALRAEAAPPAPAPPPPVTATPAATPVTPAATAPTTPAAAAPTTPAAPPSAIAPPSAPASGATAPAAVVPSAEPPAPVVLPAEPFDPQRPEIAQFIDEVVGRDGLNRKDVAGLLKEAQPQQKILEIMTRPLERVAPWWAYRQHFVTSERVAEGAQFWLDHRLALEHAAAQYQVPPEYLVAIIGMETRYGRITGSYRVLDALATLAFDYPPRAHYFRGELEQFLLLTRENRLDPLELRGSYAGAMGVPQFMPSAYRRYAVDADANHSRDLWKDWDDILASVGNYLHEYGWEPGAPVLAETSLDPDPNFQIEPHDLNLDRTVGELGAHGVRVGLALPPETPAVLLSAEQSDGPAYRVGFRNFYVITRYNNSARYAMAVYDLAQGIVAAVHGTQP